MSATETDQPERLCGEIDVGAFRGSGSCETVGGFFGSLRGDAWEPGR